MQKLHIYCRNGIILANIAYNASIYSDSLNMLIISAQALAILCISPHIVIMIEMHATTILAVRKNNKLVMAGDGQVSLGHSVMKNNAVKVRRLGSQNNVLAGFAGATADAFTLFERLEKKLEQYPSQLTRASVELAKDWRSDKFLRKLEAMMIVGDDKISLVLSGTGDVIEPEDGIIAIGSGGMYALAAAKAFYQHVEDAEEIARNAMKIASDICIYTNHNLTVESL